MASALGGRQRTIVLSAALLLSLTPFLFRSDSEGGYEETGSEAAEDSQNAETGESAALSPSGASLVRYNIPTSCNRAEHECRRVDECNGRKWQAIPSCKKAAKRCSEQPIAQQELMPYCKACLVSWRKMTSCGPEMNNCAKARNWCYKARVRERSAMCEADGISPAVPLERINATAVSNACVAAMRVEALTHRVAIVARKLSDLPPPPPPGKAVKKSGAPSAKSTVRKVIERELDDEPEEEDEPVVKPKYIDLTYR